MDGILEQLMRLEDAKHEAILDANAASYANCLREQSRLIADPPHWDSVASRRRLLEFSKRANSNASLYLKLNSQRYESGPHNDK